MSKLLFNALRTANRARVGLFKNRKGEVAHKAVDGSDWSFGQWFEALMGEMGELAQVRLDFEMGHIGPEEYASKVAKEIADVQTYLDLLAMRALDTNLPKEIDHPFMMMTILMKIGMYCESRKKHLRGDISDGQMVESLSTNLMPAMGYFEAISRIVTSKVPNNPVLTAHPTGIDLGAATIDKFNEVSQRVGVDVVLDVETGHAMSHLPNGMQVPIA